MTARAPDPALLLPLLPEDRVGKLLGIEPVSLGLSGAGVYAVTTSLGAFILRVQGAEVDAATFEQQLIVLRRAAAAGIAPSVVHVDEAARAVVSVRVPGPPLVVALADPARRPQVIASVVERLRVLHTLDPTGIAERDPLAHARAAWEAGKGRPGFPSWAAGIPQALDAIAATLTVDPRRGVSHNDVNPGNVVWDGVRAWLVDWDVSAVGHPYYDLATFALFLRLGDDAAFDLVARHDGAPLDDRSRASFRALRELSALLCGMTFLSLVPDLDVCPVGPRTAAPTLASVYQAMRGGELDLATARGQASMALALLQEGLPE